ncbi:MAG: AAA family ATPase [Candidatus Hodarchaeota archaeon]
MISIRNESSRESQKFQDEKEKTSKIISKSILKDTSTSRLSDIIGMDRAKQRLREYIVLPIQRPILFQGRRRLLRTIFLYGASGCGKTVLIKAIAQECNMTLFHVDITYLFSKWDDRKKIILSKIFKSARRTAPSLILFEKVDFLFPQDDEPNLNKIRRDIVLELYMQLRSMVDKKEIVYTVVETNKPWNIDRRILRHLGERIYVALPTIEDRVGLLEFYSQNFLLASSVEFSELGRHTEGYSAREIELLCKEVLMVSRRRFQMDRNLGDSSTSLEIDMKDFLLALERIERSTSPEVLARYELWRERIEG